MVARDRWATVLLRGRLRLYRPPRELVSAAPRLADPLAEKRAESGPKDQSPGERPQKYRCLWGGRERVRTKR
jgi:hypothetical protein